MLRWISVSSAVLIDESQDTAVHVEEVLEVDGDIDHTILGGALRYNLWTWEVDTVSQS